jgi:hypothetical protein
MIGILDHKWGVSPAQDRVWAQVSGIAPHKAGERLFVILQAFMDDSYRKDGLFVLGGYIASAETWVAFSKEWEATLPFGTRTKSGRYHFKMSEMAERHLMDRVPAFYDIIERHALCSLACKVDMTQLERAKERVWIPDTPIIWGFLDNPFLTCFRFLLDNFNQVRVSPPEPAQLFISRLTPPDRTIDFYFDEHSSKSAVISVWDEFVATRLEHARHLYGATPRFENDDEFLPLQAADFWAWWVRKAFEENRLDQIGEGDFGTWKARKKIPALVLAPNEDQIVSSIIAMARTIIGWNKPIYDAKFNPRPVAESPDEGSTFLRALLRWFLAR